MLRVVTVVQRIMTEFSGAVSEASRQYVESSDCSTANYESSVVLCQKPLDNMLRVVTVVPRIMTEFSGAVSEASRQYVESSNCSTANYDRVLWCCVTRKQNGGHHQNCIKSHETKWPLEFIGPSKS
jgi:hypothetical protein